MKSKKKKLSQLEALAIAKDIIAEFRSRTDLEKIEAEKLISKDPLLKEYRALQKKKEQLRERIENKYKKLNSRISILFYNGGIDVRTLRPNHDEKYVAGALLQKVNWHGADLGEATEAVQAEL